MSHRYLLNYITEQEYEKLAQNPPVWITQKDEAEFMSWVARLDEQFKYLSAWTIQCPRENATQADKFYFAQLLDEALEIYLEQERWHKNYTLNSPHYHQWVTALKKIHANLDY